MKRVIFDFDQIPEKEDEFIEVSSWQLLRLLNYTRALEEGRTRYSTWRDLLAGIIIGFAIGVFTAIQFL